MDQEAIGVDYYSLHGYYCGINDTDKESDDLCLGNTFCITKNNLSIHTSSLQAT